MVTYFIGAALLLGALYVASTQRDALGQAWDSARDSPWWLIALAILLPLVNWLLTSTVFLILTRSVPATIRPVSFGEISQLIGAAWLLNYLPLSPGLFGRLAYHKRIHGIELKHSIGTVVGSLIAGCTAIAVVGLFTFALAGRVSEAVFAGCMVGAGLTGIGWGLVQRSRGSQRWFMAAALGVRILDVLAWAVRYAVMLRVVGQPVSAPAATALAVVSQAAVQLPLLGNGLGVREWAIGLVGPLLPPWFTGAAALTRGSGLAIDLLNRACELVVAVPVGVVSMVLLARRSRVQPRA